MKKRQRFLAICDKFHKMSPKDLREIQESLARTIEKREKNEKENLQRYERLKKEIGLAREFFNSLGQQTIKDVDRVFLAVKDAREKLSEVFSSEEAHSVCHQCRGRCCGSFCGNGVDLAYFAFLGKKLPPFKKHSNPYRIRPNSDSYYMYCLFLGRRGCSLGDNKPFVCLWHVCEKISPNINNRIYRKREHVLREAKENFEKVLESIGFPQAIGRDTKYWWL